jgi:transposase
VVQVNAVEMAGQLATNQPLSRDKFLPWCAQLPAGCTVAMEGCASTHHWARKRMALNVKIISVKNDRGARMS